MNIDEYRKWAPPKRRKYGNNKPFYQGRTWDSQGECDYFKTLELKKKAGLIREIHLQEPFELVVDGQKICRYYIDFAVMENDSRMTYIEFKGKETPDWRIKWKLLKVLFDRLTPKGSRLWLVRKNENGFSTEKNI